MHNEYNYNACCIIATARGVGDVQSAGLLGMENLPRIAVAAPVRSALGYLTTAFRSVARSRG
jgi:hypothetical protein